MKLIEKHQNKGEILELLNLVKQKKITIDNFKKIMYTDVTEEEIKHLESFLYFIYNFRENKIPNFDLIIWFVLEKLGNAELLSKKIKILKSESNDIDGINEVIKLYFEKNNDATVIELITLYTEVDYNLLTQYYEFLIDNIEILEKKINLFKDGKDSIKEVIEMYKKNDSDMEIIELLYCNPRADRKFLLSFYENFSDNKEVYNIFKRYINFYNINLLFETLVKIKNGKIYNKIIAKILEMNDEKEIDEFIRELHFLSVTMSDYNFDFDINLLFRNELVFEYVLSSIEEITPNNQESNENLCFFIKLLKQELINNNLKYFFEIIDLEDKKKIKIKEILNIFEYDETYVFSKLITTSLIEFFKDSEENIDEVIDMYRSVGRTRKISKKTMFEIEVMDSMNDLNNIINSLENIKLTPEEYIRIKK